MKWVRGIAECRCKKARDEVRLGQIAVRVRDISKSKWCFTVYYSTLTMRAGVLCTSISKRSRLEVPRVLRQAEAVCCYHHACSVLSWMASLIPILIPDPL